MPYLDVMLLFVFKTSTFNFQNSQYLEIFGFIRIDFVCFSDKGFPEIYSLFHKKISFSFMPIMHKKAIATDTTILHTLAPIVRQCKFKKLIFTVSVFYVIGLQKSTEFEFEFALHIPVVI